MFTGSDLSSVTGALTGSITSDSGSIVTSTGGIELSNLTGSISLGNGITVVLGNDIGTGATQTGATETNVTQTGVIQTQSGTSYSGVTLD